MPLYREEQAASWHSLGYVRQAAGRQEDAEKAYDRALAVEEKLVADYPTVPDYQYDLAASYTNRGVLLQTDNRLAEAEKQYAKALPLLEKLAADHPDAPPYRRQLADALLNRGALYQTTNRPWRGGQETLNRSLDPRRRLAGGERKAPGYRQDLASALLNLGTLRQMNGKSAGSGGSLPRGRRPVLELAGQIPPSPITVVLEADALNDRGNLRGAVNRPAEAGGRPGARRRPAEGCRRRNSRPSPSTARNWRAAWTSMGIFLASAGRGRRRRRPGARRSPFRNN